LLTTSTRTITAWEFFRLRVVRVVPLYWLATLLMVGCAILGAFAKLRFSEATLIKSLLFIPYEHDPVLVPGWTLNYEMFFYALFALSLMLPSKFRFSGLIGALLVLVAMAYTSTILLEFLAGSIIAYLWLHKRLEIGLPASLAAITLGFVLLFNDQHFAGAILVVVGCLNPAIQATKSKLLLSLGDSSYSLYLTHLFVLAILRVVWLRLFPNATLTSSVAFLVIALISASIGGWLCYRLLEKPMTSMLHKALKSNAPLRPRIVTP
jgi:exopolysaccharide production protein ExoZ